MKRSGFAPRIKPLSGLLRTANLTADKKPSLAIKPKLRKCQVCKSPFEKRSMSHVACSPKCAQEVANLKRAKAERKIIAAKREALKTRSEWLKEAQTAFNAARREECRIAGYACISCNRPLDWTGNNVDAGHYRSVGSAPHMRFTKANVWAQCKQCNRYGAGRAVDYRIGLIARIGLEAVEALEADNTTRKWSIEDLKRIKAESKAELKALKEAK